MYNHIYVCVYIDVWYAHMHIMYICTARLRTAQSSAP